MGFCSMLLLSNILLTAWLSTAKGEEILCTPPRVENGDGINVKPVYKENERYHYKCKHGYVPKERGDAICTGSGWSSQPFCEEKTCSPPYILNGIYTPHRIIHRSDDEISYECNYGFYPVTGSTVSKCTPTGWIPVPRCTWKCVFHYVENGDSAYWEKIYVQGQSLKVQCYNGYSLQNGQDIMTCTENGWSPPPKCIRIKTCSASDIHIDNGFLSESSYIYALNRETSYRCKQGYVTNTGEISGSITCLQNGWSPQPSCIKSCDMPVFENSITKNTRTWFKLNDKLDYECLVGFENEYKHTKGSITCTYYGWSDTPSCYDSTRTCGPPPPIDNGDITSLSLPEYEPLSSVDYQCQKYYLLKGNKTITCRNGKWSEPPTCLHACVIPENIMEAHNIILKWRHTEKIYAHSGEDIEFECKRGYQKARGSLPFRTKCINGTINYPTCV